MNLNDAVQTGAASLLTAAEVAGVLRVSEKTIERWRSNGKGPKFLKVGPRRVMYRVADVEAFVST